MVWNPFKKRKGEPKAPEPKMKKAPELPVEQTPVGPVVAAPTSVGQAGSVLKHFRVSEKSSRGMGDNHYTFVVDLKANKSQIRDAVKMAYKVQVVKVNIVRLPAKKRTLGRKIGWGPAIKKAIVVLKEGHSIAAAQP